MKDQKVAVLLTCYNRREKTIACLTSFFNANLPAGYHFDIFLTDDGSTDGTYQAVSGKFPSVTIIKGGGNLFWAGGMRLAWRTAMLNSNYDAFLLLNDDVELDSEFMSNILETEKYSIENNGKKGIYSGATSDKKGLGITYGASKIKKNNLIVKLDLLTPKLHPQRCEITNANILWVDKSVVEEIGILDSKYTHGIADYDYSLKAHKKGFPVYLAPNVCGTCKYDHGNNWKSNSSIKDRISYLKSPKGLAYNEYLFYIRRHFPMFLPYSFIMLWAKTLFPSLWDQFK